MGYMVFRVLVVVLAASGVLGGCGFLGGNTDQICADTKTAFEQYMTQLKASSANDPAQWKKSTEQLAVRVDGLSRVAENEDLQKTLKSEAVRLRAAAKTVGTGDATQLNSVIAATPQRIGAACD